MQIIVGGGQEKELVFNQHIYTALMTKTASYSMVKGVLSQG